MWPMRRADKSAVLVAPNVKVRMEDQHSVTLLSLKTFLGEVLVSILVNNFLSLFYAF